jgi:hypothetical protein
MCVVTKEIADQNFSGIFSACLSLFPHRSSKSCDFLIF